MTTNSKTIAVFFGGCSTEYEVSLQSACAVIQNIDTTRYTPILIGIDRKTGQWFWYRGDIASIENDSWQSEKDCIPVFPSTDRTVHGICCLENNRLRTISFDAALPFCTAKTEKTGRCRAFWSWRASGSSAAVHSPLPCAWTRSWHTALFPKTGSNPPDPLS